MQKKIPKLVVYKNNIPSYKIIFHLLCNKSKFYAVRHTKEMNGHAEAGGF